MIYFQRKCRRSEDHRVGRGVGVGGVLKVNHPGSSNPDHLSQIPHCYTGTDILLPNSWKQLLFHRGAEDESEERI